MSVCEYVHSILSVDRKLMYTNQSSIYKHIASLITANIAAR